MVHTVSCGRKGEQFFCGGVKNRGSRSLFIFDVMPICKLVRTLSHGGKDWLNRVRSAWKSCCVVTVSVIDDDEHMAACA